MVKMRLQKFLAAAGVGSRRACEEIILEGRVSVDGIAMTKLGTSIDPDIQKVSLDGNRVRIPKKVYYLVNKPVGYICSNRRDKSKRPLVADLVQPNEMRLFSVGRLDVDTKGAIILTNDGEFSNLVSHPRYDIPKTYRVRVKGDVNAGILEKLRKGVWLAEGKTTPTEVSTIRSTRQDTIIRLTLTEGKNRLVRRILARLGLKVTELERTRIGPVRLGNLKVGKFRKLTSTEVKGLITPPRVKRKSARKKAPRRKSGR